LSDADEDDDDDDEEEDRPLAARMAIKSAPAQTSRMAPGQRSGKKGPSMKSKGLTAPTSLLPPVGQQQAEMNGKTNGINGHEMKVKVEDKMDEGRLTRLATGVTVDTGGRTPACVHKLLNFPVSEN
jgi:histone acetyltransferase